MTSLRETHEARVKKTRGFCRAVGQVFRKRFEGGIVAIPYLDGSCVVVRSCEQERTYYPPEDLDLGNRDEYMRWLEELADRVAVDFPEVRKAE